MHFRDDLWNVRICGCRGRCNGFPQLITPDNRTNRNALRPIAVATAEPADEAAIAATEAPVPTAGETREDVEIADLKAQIARAEMDLDIQTQEFALDEDMVYSNPNYTDLRVGKAKLDAEQRRIN